MSLLYCRVKGQKKQICPYSLRKEKEEITKATQQDGNVPERFYSYEQLQYPTARQSINIQKTMSGEIFPLILRGKLNSNRGTSQNTRFLESEVDQLFS